MEEVLPAFINTPGGVAGSIGGALLTLAYLVRKFLLTDKVASATATGNVDLIERLMAAADRAELRAAASEQRAELAYKERNEAYQKIGELGEQVRTLRSQVDALQRTLDAKIA